jgi:hypothetical protein
VGMKRRCAVQPASVRGEEKNTIIRHTAPTNTEKDRRFGISGWKRRPVPLRCHADDRRLAGSAVTAAG